MRHPIHNQQFGGNPQNFRPRHVPLLRTPHNFYQQPRHPQQHFQQNFQFRQFRPFHSNAPPQVLPLLNFQFTQEQLHLQRFPHPVLENIGAQLTNHSNTRNDFSQGRPQNLDLQYSGSHTSRFSLQNYDDRNSAISKPHHSKQVPHSLQTNERVWKNSSSKSNEPSVSNSGVLELPNSSVESDKIKESINPNKNMEPSLTEVNQCSSDLEQNIIQTDKDITSQKVPDIYCKTTHTNKSVIPRRLQDSEVSSKKIIINSKINTKKNRSKCKIHSHKPIPWPGSSVVKSEQYDKSAVSPSMISLGEIKKEPGTFVNNQVALALPINSTSQNRIPSNLPIKREINSPISDVQQDRNSPIERPNLKRSNDSTLASRISPKIIKLERNNVVSIRSKYASNTPPSGIERNGANSLSSVKQSRKIDPLNSDKNVSQPDESVASVTGSNPTVSDCEPISPAIASGAASTSSQIRGTDKLLTVARSSENLYPLFGDGCSDVSDMAALSDTDSFHISSPVVSDQTANSAENFLDMIYNDLAQSIPLKLLNVQVPFNKTHIIKIFGFCGKVLSYKRELTHHSTNPGKFLSCFLGKINYFLLNFIYYYLFHGHFFLTFI